MRTEAIVCGAGVAGLATACALGNLGLRVALVDKQDAPKPVAKGEVFQPGSLRILRSWGVAQRLESAGALRLARLVARDSAGTPQMALDYGTLPGKDRWLLAHDYPAILTALTESLPSTVEFRRGVLVKGLLRNQDGQVTGVRLADGTIEAPLVVAADGMSSRLRKEAGIEITRAEYPHRLVALELHDAPEVEADFSAYVTERGLRLRYPLPGGRIRLYAQVRPDELRGGDLVSWGRALARETPALTPLEDAILAALPERQVLPVARFLAPKLWIPGLALAGEAGHAVHPMAAQGMNSAIADADCLATVLAESGDLASYHRRRQADLALIGRTSHAAARMITDLSWAGRTLGRRALRHTGANQRLRYTVMHNMSGLGSHPLTPLDRLHQIGLLPDPRARRLPAWA
ncbi:NAD(P)/FAD-dependent oxidoreductase [Amycolatopsis sp. YIM 10]|uniref:FAD-dependent oxidoreductase n=1 Tax=Amycolatopsis sp. YIM 10 TaxID=2653857 RepID=UPI0012900C70|nr:NAD(P)/FAD-dependent oxidoreductase [Amycolatopsis sp. YIM 10]QFU88211.1 2-octaprenyl-3-methyl-6-methoxy-1,4-benzoquinol hydroxylase [Amycolatopsis sp. YIM 10]